MYVVRSLCVSVLVDDVCRCLCIPFVISLCMYLCMYDYIFIPARACVCKCVRMYVSTHVKISFPLSPSLFLSLSHHGQRGRHSYELSDIPTCWFMIFRQIRGLRKWFLSVTGTTPENDLSRSNRVSCLATIAFRGKVEPRECFACDCIPCCSWRE